MKTVKVNVTELSGPALDWLVAKCENNPVARHNTGAIFLIDTPWADKSRVKWLAEYSPTRHWAQGGPIIQRERIDLSAKINAGSDFDEWRASVGIGAKQRHRYGDTPLIAAMRCYVASKLGEVVEVPAELLK